MQLRRKNERGAIIIHVAIALVALLAFTSFVIDYGVMWVSKRQAQNVADAGALAGALALINDGGTPAVAILAGQHFSANNPVWGQGNTNGNGNTTGNVVVTPSGASNSIPPCGTNPGCVRVDVYRNTPDRDDPSLIRGNPLPTYFSQLVGVTDQGVRATATAETSGGRSIKCLLPFAVIDRWSDNHDENPDPTYFPNDPITSPGVTGWSANDEYRPASGDVYIPPYNGNTNHTGWKVPADYGRQLILKDGSPGNYSAGWANEVDLPNSTGSQDYKWNIEHCNEQPVGIATASEPCDEVDEPIGCVSVKTGVSQGPTSQGIGALAKGLIGQDQSAEWDWAAAGPYSPTKPGAVVGGGGMATPRIRPIVIIDINNYVGQGCSGTTCVAKVANIVGFFVEGMCEDVFDRGDMDGGMICDDPKKDVVGRIVNLPSTYVVGAGNAVETNASFIRIVRLVR